jgi:hypothetical protein
MSNLKVKTICKDITNLYVDRMWHLTSLNQEEDATSLYEELKEWITEDTDHEVIYLEFFDQ